MNYKEFDHGVFLSQLGMGAMRLPQTERGLQNQLMTRVRKN